MPSDGVQAADFRGVYRVLRGLPRHVRRRVQGAAVRGAGKVFLREVRDRIPVRTGRARRHVRMAFRRRGDDATARVGIARPFYRLTHLLEFGTKPHVIRARRGASWKRFRKRQRINHPGARARPFLGPAFRSSHADATRAALRAARVAHVRSIFALRREYRPKFRSVRGA